jgi:hypothetical protein
MSSVPNTLKSYSNWWSSPSLIDGVKYNLSFVRIQFSNDITIFPNICFKLLLQLLIFELLLTETTFVSVDAIFTAILTFNTKLFFLFRFLFVNIIITNTRRHPLVIPRVRVSQTSSLFFINKFPIYSNLTIILIIF